MSVSPKQERFCEEYVVDFNGAKAAERAGYSPKAAKEQASRLLTKANVKARIDELKAALSERTGITAEKVIAELAKIGFSNFKDFVNADNEIVDISTVEDEKGAVISGIKKTVVEFEGGSKTTTHITLFDKASALEKLGRHLGIFETDNNQKRAIIQANITDE